MEWGALSRATQRDVADRRAVRYVAQDRLDCLTSHLFVCLYCLCGRRLSVAACRVWLALHAPELLYPSSICVSFVCVSVCVTGGHPGDRLLAGVATSGAAAHGAMQHSNQHRARQTAKCSCLLRHSVQSLSGFAN